MSTLTQRVINRNEQITALRSIALDYKSVSSITSTPTHVIMVVTDLDEAGNLYAALLKDGWAGVTIHAGQLSNMRFIRIPILLK